MGGTGPVVSCHPAGSPGLIHMAPQPRSEMGRQIERGREKRGEKEEEREREVVGGEERDRACRGA